MLTSHALPHTMESIRIRSWTGLAMERIHAGFARQPLEGATEEVPETHKETWGRPNCHQLHFMYDRVELAEIACIQLHMAISQWLQIDWNW